MAGGQFGFLKFNRTKNSVALVGSAVLLIIVEIQWNLFGKKYRKYLMAWWGTPVGANIIRPHSNAGKSMEFIQKNVSQIFNGVAETPVGANIIRPHSNAENDISGD